MAPLQEAVAASRDECRRFHCPLRNKLRRDLEVFRDLCSDHIKALSLRTFLDQKSPAVLSKAPTVQPISALCKHVCMGIAYALAYLHMSIDIKLPRTLFDAETMDEEESIGWASHTLSSHFTARDPRTSAQ